jgi:DnaK suppressor protein
MIDGMLLEAAEGLDESGLARTGGEIWEWLQGEKEKVFQEILAEGPLRQEEVGGLQESDPSDESPRAIEWWHRGQLEARLRDLNCAQDRLIDGGYGRCNICGNEIGNRRLEADPAVSLCFACQTATEETSRLAPDKRI